MSVPEKPTGREETYLAYIAGQNVQIPGNPQGRVEEYLDYIARNGGGGGGASIDDSTPAYNKVYSSEKVEDKFFLYDKDIITRRLKITPDMELSNILSNETLYLFGNENIAYTSDVAETTANGVTYKIKDGLIYLNGTASKTFYLPCDTVIPKNWAGWAVLGKLEIVSGTIATQHIRMKLPCTYMSSNEEKQFAITENANSNLRIISVTDVTPQIQVSSGAVCTNLVLRPFMVLRTKAWSDYGWTDLPTPSRRIVSETSLVKASGILMTLNGDFSAHVKNRNYMDKLFGKKMALCGDSIAYGHSGDSFGYTIAEKENMLIDKPAVGEARFTSNSQTTSIATQVCSLTKTYDYIIVEGGINDALHNETIGTLTTDYSSESYDETTVLGAAEKAFKFLVENYPDTKKLFVLCHKCTNANCVPYVAQETYFDALITALKKWNIPYIDLRNFPLCAYTVAIGQRYFGSDFGSGGSLHPNNAGYALGYVDQITEKLKNI
jgi:hypothetical protein